MGYSNDFGFIIDSNDTYKSLYGLIRDLIVNHPHNQYVCFAYDTNRITNRLGVPTLPLSQCKFFNGRIWISDVESLIISRGFPNISHTYFYVKDIPWSGSEANYLYLNKIYGQADGFSVITKNEIIYNIYKNCWQNTPIGNMKDITYENFKKILLSSK